MESFVDSLNKGISFDKLYFEGQDCLQRLQCLERFRHELNDLEQEGSISSIEELSEKYAEIRLNLSHYYLQRMKSIKQMKTLEEQLDAISNEFEESREQKIRNSHHSSPAPVGSHANHNHHLRVDSNPSKMMRVSLNISECDRSKI
jgi:hypothetical protein